MYSLLLTSRGDGQLVVGTDGESCACASRRGCQLSERNAGHGGRAYVSEFACDVSAGLLSVPLGQNGLGGEHGPVEATFGICNTDGDLRVLGPCSHHDHYELGLRRRGVDQGLPVVSQGDDTLAIRGSSGFLVFFRLLILVLRTAHDSSCSGRGSLDSKPCGWTDDRPFVLPLQRTSSSQSIESSIFNFGQDNYILHMRILQIL